MTARLPVRGPGRARTSSPRRATRLFDRRRILAGILMLAAGGAMYGVAVSPAFAVRGTVVEGGTLVGAETLSRLIGMTDPAPNAFRVETDAIAARLAALPGIDRAEVSVSLPGTLHVRLAEREAVLAWRIGDSTFLVDRTGYVIADAGARDATDAARNLAAALPSVVDRRPDVALAAAAEAAAREAEIRAAAAANDELAPDDDTTAPQLGPTAPALAPGETRVPAKTKAGASPKAAVAAAKAARSPRPGAKAKPSPSPSPAVAKKKASTRPSLSVVVAPGDQPIAVNGAADAAGAPEDLDTAVVAAHGPAAPPDRIPGIPVPGEVLAGLDLDIATRLLSLAPADVGSAAPGLAVIVDSAEGWTLRPVDGEPWVAVFGLYSEMIRPPDMIPAQVRILRSLLAWVGEETVKRIVLADARRATYVKR